MQNLPSLTTFRNPRSVFHIVLLLTAFLALPFTAQAGPETSPAPAEAKAGLERLVGSWSGASTDGTTFLLTFDASRTYTVTFVVPGGGAGHGHGAWKRTSLDTFALTDQSFVFNPVDDSLALLQKTRVSANVSGNEADLELQVTLTLPDGTPVDSFEVLATATRIEVEPLP